MITWSYSCRHILILQAHCIELDVVDVILHLFSILVLFAILSLKVNNDRGVLLSCSSNFRNVRNLWCVIWSKTWGLVMNLLTCLIVWAVLMTNRSSCCSSIMLLLHISLHVNSVFWPLRSWLLFYLLLTTVMGIIDLSTFLGLTFVHFETKSWILFAVVEIFLIGGNMVLL